MKVFIYYSGYGNTGGITTQVRFYAIELVRCGHEVTIGGLGRPWWRQAAVKVEGVHYLGGQYLPKRSWFPRLDLDSPEMLCTRLVQHLRKNRYDIVHCLGWHLTNIYILWAGLVSGARNLYTATSTADKWYPADFEKCGLLLHGVHGPTRSIAETIRQRMKLDRPCYVFPISPDRLREPVDRLPDNPHSVGFMGHLEDHKQVDRLVRVWAHVVAQLDRAHLHLFGSGTSEASLREQTRQLGLEGSVTFHGYVPDLEKVFSQFSTLIVMTKEGLSLSAVEALCAGRSLILPRDGCFPELYGKCRAVGMFSPDATDVEITDIVVETLTRGLDDDTRKAARKFFEERFSPKVVGEQLIACYQDLIRSDSSFTTEAITSKGHV